MLLVIFYYIPAIAKISVESEIKNTDCHKRTHPLSFRLLSGIGALVAAGDPGGHSLLHVEGPRECAETGPSVWLMEPASLLYSPYLIFYSLKYHLNVAGLCNYR